MKTTTIFTIVLAILLLVSLVQAFQLNGIKDKLADETLSVGSASVKTPAASSGGSSGAPKSLPTSIQDLPTMVGGC